jgi:hypothetical protein
MPHQQPRRAQGRPPVRRRDSCTATAVDVVPPHPKYSATREKSRTPFGAPPPVPCSPGRQPLVFRLLSRPISFPAAAEKLVNEESRDVAAMHDHQIKERKMMRRIKRLAEVNRPAAIPLAS